MEKIKNLAASIENHASFDYISKLAEQLIWFVDQNIELSRAADGTIFFGDHRTKIESILELTPFKIGHLEDAHFCSAKFLRELSYGSSHNYNDSEIVLFYLFPEFRQIDYKKVDEIRFGIPVALILEPQIKEINSTHSMLKKVEAWEESLKQWDVRVKQSEDRYQGVIDATNYLGLGNAFDKMLQEKRRERDGLRSNLTKVGLITLVIPVIFLLSGTSNFIQSLFSDDVKTSVSSISTFVFSIALEALLLYYFRIIYGQWLIAKKHVLQLSLRHEMCAFVNEYAKSAKDMDRTTLSKFENLVFSELSADLNAPPSVYDAVDSIAKVISSLKKPES
ncbi:hypothetical protein [Pseudomonas sp. R2-60-08W]|uniref:hypothetical protein n=1 Tax=Pseudomonas sp. R2-60-08W TaxID=1173280 RepID=UPI000F564259|nr:hypothetical protein [Pseudomonas sp. R2-60-08W]